MLAGWRRGARSIFPMVFLGDRFQRRAPDSIDMSMHFALSSDRAVLGNLDLQGLLKGNDERCSGGRMWDLLDGELMNRDQNDGCNGI